MCYMVIEYGSLETVWLGSDALFFLVIFKKHLFIYLAVPGLSLWHAAS